MKLIIISNKYMHIRKKIKNKNNYIRIEYWNKSIIINLSITWDT